ncbi:MAG: UDP-glucose 4-epimerase GalE [Acidobacteria bacterium]|nr:UDP-glucose 4-epimerase GalE [Acidobacteriota bacterium]
MRVLVTGGAGYIGSHTAKALARAGHEVVVLDNFSGGHKWAIKWGPCVEGDIADTPLVAQALKTYGIDSLVHFAASIQVGESVRDPKKYFWNNVVGTLRLLDAMMEAGVPHVVFSSSAAVYGNPEKVPIPEDHPTRPVNPYGETKLMMERALEWYGAAYGMRWIALRYFNAAGADPEGELGEDHEPESHLIPLVIRAAMGRIPHVDVFGTDYPTKDGTAIRDYIHIADLADAHLKALEHLARGGESMALNLGAGHGHTVREVIAAVERVANVTAPARNAPRRAGDPPALVADPSKAMSILNWKPNLSGLDQIVECAWKWHSKEIED